MYLDKINIRDSVLLVAHQNTKSGKHLLKLLLEGGVFHFVGASEGGGGALQTRQGKEEEERGNEVKMEETG